MRTGAGLTWGGCGAVAAGQEGAHQAAAPQGNLLFAHELVKQQLLFQVKGAWKREVTWA